MKKHIYNLVIKMYNSQSKYSVLAFFIPFSIFFASFAVLGVHPFGPSTILSVDAYHQYAPFLVELRNKILSGESLFHSWHIGLGTNFWAVFANYSASPLNVIILLFPAKYVADGIALIVCLRAGLAGLCMSFFLREIDKGRKDLFLVMFSSFYALCGWVLSYYWNIMWMDAVVLLPLIVLGLRRLLRDGKPVLFCLSLFTCLWSNFFVGFFVCFFLLAFAPISYVTWVDKKTVRGFFLAAGRFALFSLLAGAMAAALLLPTYLALSHTSATGDSFPNVYLTQDMFDFFSRFMFLSTPNIRDGMANVYSGVPALVFLPLFFICRKIKLSEKIAYGVALLFIYYGFAVRLMDFIWHGFHFPNQIPFRQAFLMSFLMIIIAYRVLRNLSSFKISDIMFSVALILSYIIIYPKIGVGKEGFRALALTAVFVVVYATLIRALLIAPERSRRIAYGLVAVMVLEMVLATQFTLLLISIEEGYPNWDFIGKQASEVRAFSEEKEADKDVGPFVRMEIFPHYACNQPAIYHLKGVSVFSSTARESSVQVMRSLGLHNNTINSTRVLGINEVTASLLGVRYFIDLENAQQYPTAFVDSVFERDGLRISENENALSLGYVVRPEVLEYNPSHLSNPLVMTNMFLETIGAPAVYERVEMDVVLVENVEQTGSDVLMGITFGAAKLSEPGGIECVLIGDYEDRQIYFYSTLYELGRLKTTYDDEQTQDGNEVVMPFTRRQIIDAGRFAYGNMQSVRIEWDTVSKQTFTVYAYSVNPDAFAEMIDVLRTSELVVDSYDSTHVNGHIDVKEEGLLLLTMTYDEGWRATVNGESVEIINVAGAFCGIMLPEGEHEISLVYVPEGFYAGMIISISAMLVFAIFVLGMYLRKKRRGAEPRINSTEDEASEEHIEVSTIQDSDAITD